MNLQQIKYFLAVIDAGTFLAASEMVHVSQPTLSAGIKKLEDSLGVKLFHRGGRKAILTREGEIFHSQARDAYAKLINVKSQLSGEVSTVRIGVSNSVPMPSITEMMKSYVRLHPSSIIEITVGNSNILKDELMLGKINLLFSERIPCEAECKVLFTESLELVVSKDNPLSTLDVINIHEINGFRFVDRRQCDVWHKVQSLIESRDIVLHKVCSAEEDETVLSLVSSDLGVSIMPRRNTPYHVAFVRINELNVLRPICLYHDVSDNPQASVLLECAMKFWGHNT
ncbi:MAG: hypothetical protein AXA67_01335 [Methylothermaceae bacteria B42]|nr:MAG: hypothetical protein AXA67_01335 [Methylothermaceae bacteria B42]